MRLHRFYIEETLEKGKRVRIENPELLHQWIKVFRFSVADRVVLFNGNGKEYEGFFELLSKKEAVIVIDKEKKIENIPATELHLFQSIIKKDNFELVVEKCTEIGASAFHPIISERSEKKDLNIERLQKIAKEASEQSGRAYLPEIFEPVDLENAIENLPAGQAGFEGKMFALDFNGEKIETLRQAQGKKLGLFVGPEGGWTDRERELFRQKGIKSVSLGPQILRAETAAIVASAIVLLK